MIVTIVKNEYTHLDMNLYYISSLVEVHLDNFYHHPLELGLYKFLYLFLYLLHMILYNFHMHPNWTNLRLP